MRQFFHHLLLPHVTNNFRAKALDFEFFAGYIFLLLAPFVIFVTLLLTKPGVLGITAFFNPNQIVAKTNEARAKAGVPKLATNSQLSSAAQKKAEDMVFRGYWAHYAPDGTTPWDFVRQAGYNFIAAGENLARDFDSLDPMIAAWLASPTHAENLLSKNFTEVGVGVAEGIISGKTTTVVVQMFGKPAGLHLAQTPAQNKQTAQELVAIPAEVKTVLEGQPVKGSPKPQTVQLRGKEVIDVEKLISPFVLNYFSPVKILSLIITALILTLFLADFVFVKFAKIAHRRGHPIFHLVILILVFLAIWYSNSGLIL